jgi:prepilin-type processing-associated H-X9-DG protein/prepilin-type N-terminal cleavage/methylation domain-containing protein
MYPAFDNCKLKHYKRRPRTQGLTLVEMLIVLGIIALIAAILFPVLGRAREAGRRASCLSNLRQLGTAFQQYATDAGRRYPRAGVYTQFAGHTGWAPGNGHWVAGTADEPIACIGPDRPLGSGCTEVGEYRNNWKANPEAGALFPYIRSAAVFICPSNSTGRPKRLSYSMNCAVSGLHDVRIKQPSDIVLLIDEEEANDGYFFAINDGPAGSTASGQPTDSTDALTPIHNSGGNLLFCDGHAKFFPTQKLKLDGSPEGKANKWRDSGSPRFHDSAFGQWGSNQFLGATTDACNATQR